MNEFLKKALDELGVSTLASAFAKIALQCLRYNQKSLGASQIMVYEFNAIQVRAVVDPKNISADVVVFLVLDDNDLDTALVISSEHIKATDEHKLSAAVESSAREQLESFYTKIESTFALTPHSQMDWHIGSAYFRSRASKSSQLLGRIGRKE